MGVKGAHPLFKKKGLVSKCLEDLSALGYQRILVDLFGSFYAELLKAAVKLTNEYHNRFQIFIDLLKSTFANQHPIFIVDGLPTLAKAATSAKRKTNLLKDIKKLEGLVTQMDKAVKDGKSRMSKSFYANKDRLRKRTTVIDAQFKTELVNAMNAAGFTVILASGEADVEISRIATGM